MVKTKTAKHSTVARTVEKNSKQSMVTIMRSIVLIIAEMLSTNVNTAETIDTTPVHVGIENDSL
jgi:hypothetical protein